MKNDQTLPAKEKLKSRKMIGQIFSDGSAVKSYPIRIQFLFHDIQDLPYCQVGVSVSKRNFKNAVDRNRIKRLLREAFRLNKNVVTDALMQRDKRLAMMMIYSSNKKLTYDEIEVLVKKAMSKIRI